MSVLTGVELSEARAEYARRRDAQRAFALRKYGTDALAPTGRPDLDVFDYAINEVVGLVRYAEMLQARHRMMLDLMDGMAPMTRRAVRDALAFAKQLRAAAERIAVEAIAVRRRLKDRGLALGDPEAQ